MNRLSISSPSELESLIITAIYSSLIAARLSSASSPPFVNVTSVAPLRDVKPQSLPSMISVLTEWELRCGEVVSGLEAEIAKIHADATKRRAKQQERASLLDEAVSTSDSKGPSKEGRSGGGSNKREFNDEGYHADEDPSSHMDIDDAAGSSRTAACGSFGGDTPGLSKQAKRFVGKKKS